MRKRIREWFEKEGFGPVLNQIKLKKAFERNKNENKN